MRTISFGIVLGLLIMALAGCGLPYGAYDPLSAGLYGGGPYYGGTQYATPYATPYGAGFPGVAPSYPPVGIDPGGLAYPMIGAAPYVSPYYSQPGYYSGYGGPVNNYGPGYPDHHRWEHRGYGMGHGPEGMRSGFAHRLHGGPYMGHGPEGGRLGSGFAHGSHGGSWIGHGHEGGRTGGQGFTHMAHGGSAAGHGHEEGGMGHNR